MKWQSEERAF